MAVGIHWYSGTGDGDGAKMWERLGQRERETRRGMYGWAWATKARSGALMLWGGRLDYHMIIPGETWEEVEDQHAFLIKLRGCKATRIDLAFDGASHGPKYYHQLDPELLRARAIRKGRGYEYISSCGGDTYYIGAPASERRLRIYDRRGFNRMEVQLRGRVAEQASRDIFEGCSVGGQTALRIRESAEVVRRGYDLNRRRWQVEDWYEKMLGECAGDKVKPMPDTGERGHMKWLHSVVKPCLLRVVKERLEQYGGDEDQVRKELLQWVLGDSRAFVA